MKEEEDEVVLTHVRMTKEEEAAAAFKIKKQEQKDEGWGANGFLNSLQNHGRTGTVWWTLRTTARPKTKAPGHNELRLKHEAL